MIPTKDTVTVVRAEEYDDWGRPIGSSTEDFSCRIEYQSEVVKSDNGEDAVSKAIILIKGVALVTTSDTVEWVDPYGEHSAQPISVSPLKDLSSKVIFTKVVV